MKPGSWLGPASRLVLAVVLAGALAGCASTGPSGEDDDYPGGASKDPFESFNRKVDAFNTTIDDNLLAPTARAYRDYVPEPIRFFAGNFFSNIQDAWTGVNNLLQGKPGAAASDLGRLAINFTFGFFWISDPASEMGLEKNREDFGQTLGVWGVPSGPYLVLPLFGPSSIRDAGGFAVDQWVDPLGQLVTRDPPYVAAAVTRVVDTRAQLLRASNLLEGAALDRYSFVRDAYLQRRRNLVYDGNPPLDDD